MIQKHRVWIAWLLCAICVVTAIAELILWLAGLMSLPSLANAVEEIGFDFAPALVFSTLAALIISRQPANRVGWLLMIVALGTVNPVSDILAALPAPPPRLTPGLYLLLWLDNWSWIPSVFALFLIPLHFPTGSPPSPRWNWVNRLAIGMFLLFNVFVLSGDTIGPANEAWTLPNPAGWLPLEKALVPFLIIWGCGLLTMLLAGVISLIYRYRHTSTIERQQIKWVLYAGAIFALIYLISMVAPTGSDFLVTGWGNLLFSLAIMSFPAAIAIAILRHRLWDIDIIIRRTLQYALVTALLGLVYFGSVVLLQSLFTAVSGQQSPAAVVLSTLAIAALFTPLRRRIQDFIDRRFYRRKYDAERALAGFAAAARSEAELAQLAARLTDTVQETLQPEQASLWIVRSANRERP